MRGGEVTEAHFDVNVNLEEVITFQCEQEYFEREAEAVFTDIYAFVIMTVDAFPEEPPKPDSKQLKVLTEEDLR